MVVVHNSLYSLLRHRNLYVSLKSSPIPLTLYINNAIVGNSTVRSGHSEAKMSDSVTKFNIILVSGASISPEYLRLSVDEARELADKHNDCVVSGHRPMSSAAVVMCDGAILHGLGDHPKFEG